MYKHFFKRLLDFVLSAIGLILLLPVLVVVAVLLFFVNEGKPFFLQERPGKEEKIFQIIKFKTMNDKRDGEGNLLSDEQRITKIGKLVRSFSLDEIPQLLNVIKGDMSLIGPRPLLVEYLPLYNAEQRKRHKVLPGITGWAQVNGRNAISWQQKFECDVYYVDNLTFMLDMIIIFKTIINVILAKDINANEHITMEYFNGNN